MTACVCCADGSRGGKIPRALSPTSLAERHAPGSVRELVSENEVENDQGRASVAGVLRLWVVMPWCSNNACIGDT